MIREAWAAWHRGLEVPAVIHPLFDAGYRIAATSTCTVEQEWRQYEYDNYFSEKRDVPAHFRAGWDARRNLLETTNY